MRASSDTSGRGFSRTRPHSWQRTTGNGASVVSSYSCSRPTQRTSSALAPQPVQGGSTVLISEVPVGPEPGLVGPGRSGQGCEVAGEGTEVAAAQQAGRGGGGGRKAALHLGQVPGRDAREQVMLRVIVHEERSDDETLQRVAADGDEPVGVIVR